MLRYAAIFFGLALIAAIFGFTGLSATFAGLAQFLFVVFVVLFVISAIFGYRARNPPAI